MYYFEENILPISNIDFKVSCVASCYRTVFHGLWLLSTPARLQASWLRIPALLLLSLF